VRGRARTSCPPTLAAGWLTWLVLAGRGFGKTRCGAEWIRAEVTPSAPGALR
jgi:phage terminase large subunit-like protein